MMGVWCVQAALTIAEIVGAYLFTDFIAREKIFGFRKWIFIIGMGVLACLTVYQRTYSMYSRVWLVSTILYCCLFSILCYKKERISSCITYAIYFETVYCLDLFVYVSIAMIFLDKNFLVSQFRLGGERIVVFLITRSIMAIFMILVCKKKREDFYYFKTSQSVWIIILILEHLGLIFCDRIFIPEYEKNAIDGWKIFCMIYPFLIILIVFFFAKQKYKMMYEQIKVQNTLFYGQFETMKKEFREKEQIYHDYRNHLILLQKMVSCGDGEQAQNYINDLLKSAEKECMLRVGHPVLDYLLQVKILDAYQKNIQIEEEYVCNLCGVDEDRIRDWGVLLGNLWDNALEGCEGIREEKKIFFSVKQIGNMIMVKIENSCHQNVNPNNLKTTKIDSKMHGIGSQNIEFVVNKHEGTIKRMCENGIFTIQIIMIE